MTERIRSHGVAAALSVVPVLMMVVATRQGIGISPDSVTYASTLRVLEQTESWSFASLFPPGFPAIVALLGLSGTLVINGLAFWLNMMTSYFLALEVTESVRLSLWILAWLAVSTFHVQVYSMLWTEPLFCLIVNLMLLTLARVHRARYLSWRQVALLITLLNAACLLRYAGAALILFAAIAITVALGGAPTRRLATGAAIALLGTTALAATFAANVLSGQSVMGPRLDSVVGLKSLILQLLDAVAQRATNLPLQGVGLTVGLPLITFVLWLLVRWVWRLGAREAFRHPMTILLGWLGVYLAFILYSEMTTWLIPVNSRLLAPILSSAAIVALFALRQTAPIKPGRALSAVAGAYLVVLVSLTLIWADFAGDRGLAFSSTRFTTWDLPQAVDEVVPSDAILVSNQPVLLAWLTGRDLVRGSPDAGPAPSGAVYTQDVSAALQPGDYLVWMDPFQDRGLPPESSLDTLFRGDSYTIFRFSGDHKPD